MIIKKEVTKKDLPSVVALIRSERVDGRKISHSYLLVKSKFKQSHRRIVAVVIN